VRWQAIAPNAFGQIIEENGKRMKQVEYPYEYEITQGFDKGKKCFLYKKVSLTSSDYVYLISSDYVYVQTEDGRSFWIRRHELNPIPKQEEVKFPS
jgi:hypothetical protein